MSSFTDTIVSPSYRIPPQVRVLQETHTIKCLLTKIRDEKSNREDFVFYADRLIRLLVEEGLSFTPVYPVKIKTPTGSEIQGYEFAQHICGVSIIRAGESMEAALRQVCRGVRIGKRDEATALPKLFYSKLPQDIARRTVLLLDPMLATGGSCIKAIDVLKENGVTEDKIVFVCVVAAPEGIEALVKAFPSITIVTAHVDERLSAKKYILPGLGDFGDRYFGTV